MIRPKRKDAFVDLAPSRIQRQEFQAEYANPNEFTFPNYGSFVYWVTKGYVVLDDAAFPYYEGTTEPNDNFITQLVDNAEAAINAVDALGYINRKSSRWWSLYGAL
jgi:hypothetical protein